MRKVEALGDESGLVSGGCWFMDSSYDGTMLDPSKCTKLSIEEKMSLVYDLSELSHDAAAVLHSFSRQELMQIACAESGKERKYTGWPKQRLIDQLLRIAAEKKGADHDLRVLRHQQSPIVELRASTRQRKLDHPSRIPLSSGLIPMSYGGSSNRSTGIYCKNSACKASLSRTDEFCRRCSCCLCRKFDDNKDPSLWLTCCSEPPFQGHACDMSCHLECFPKRGASNIAKAVKGVEFDGTFYCVSCGKVNDFLSCWRKQLIVAKETRRVDILCYRLSLCERLLKGTTLYRKVAEIVDEAVKKLEADVGPINSSSMKMGRGIVNRLSAGPEVQRLCGSAIEALESMMYHTSSSQLPDHILPDYKLESTPDLIRFEDISPTSVMVVLGTENPSLGNGVGYTLWHHKANEEKAKGKPTCTLFPPETRFLVSDLAPATEYVFKVITFDNDKELSSCYASLTTTGLRGETADAKGSSEVETSHSPTTNCSTLSNPSSVEDEAYHTPPFNEKLTNNYFDYYNTTQKVISVNSSDDIAPHDGAKPTFASNTIIQHHPMDEAYGLKLESGHKADGQSGRADANHAVGLPITPCRIDTSVEHKRRVIGRPCMRGLEDGYEKGDVAQTRVLSKRTSEVSRDEECDEDDVSDEDLGKYVKVVRQLEKEGHLESSFRQKFLTWYTMRATPQEERVVKVFIDALSDDPGSLAEQLIDTFGEIVSSKRMAVVPGGFCMKLWH
ncbi:VIN3-like protein [Drosera capensis]